MVRRKKILVLLEKYTKSADKFRSFRKKMLDKPEQELSEKSVELNLSGLRNDLLEQIKKEITKLWRLYKRIWSGDPTMEDVDEFLEIADNLTKCDEFLSVKARTSIQVHRELVAAFKHTQED